MTTCSDTNRRAGRPARSRSRRPAGWAGSVLLLALLLSGSAVLLAAPVRAAEPTCGDVTVVFARGSGQRLGQRESAAFFAGLSARLGTEVRANAYELGTARYGGSSYPAVGVGLDSSDAFENLLDAGAFWSGSAGGRYRGSVAAGAAELRGYLGQRLAACPAERFVLGGYSQGAQVVGDALPTLARAVRDRVVFVSLFGDPKLYLPEGKGIFPSACRGAKLSPWRRGAVSCYTDNGVLESRRPYLPTDIERRVGSWCDRNDPICNNNVADFVHSTHGRYTQPGSGVDQAVRESAQAVRRVLGDRGRRIDVAVSLERADPAVVVPVDERTPEPGETTVASARSPSPAGPASPAGSPSPLSPASPPSPAAPAAPSLGPTRPPTAVRPALAISEYWAEPGAAVHFDASAVAGDSYRWDFDGDGTTDRFTTAPIADHTYPTGHDGMLRLRVGGADEAVLSAPVHINRVGLAGRLPADPIQVTVRAAPETTGALVSWRDASAAGPVDAWRVHDADGRLLAHLPGSARRVQLSALPPTTTALTVEAVNEYGTSAPTRATPKGAGASRFLAPAVPPAGRATAGGEPDAVTGRADASALATTRPPAGLVATAAALLLATAGTLWVWLLRSRTLQLQVSVLRGRQGRHRRGRRDSR